MMGASVYSRVSTGWIRKRRAAVVSDYSADEGRLSSDPACRSKCTRLHPNSLSLPPSHARGRDTLDDAGRSASSRRFHFGAGAHSRSNDRYR